MPRKTAAQVQKEAEELEQEAKRLRAEERKAESSRAQYRRHLLGIYLERLLATDPNLRARVEVDMHTFLTRPRDRELFAIDESQTWFDRLAAQNGAAPTDARPTKERPPARPSARPSAPAELAPSPDAKARSSAARASVEESSKERPLATVVGLPASSVSSPASGKTAAAGAGS